MANNKEQLELYQTLYLIRAAELAIIDKYFDNEMKTPMHMSLGAEHIATGVHAALLDQAYYYCTYRSHATYLAVTQDSDGFFSELYGRVDGCAKGKAGSMHLSDVSQGLLMASAIVGSTLAPAVGTAYANKLACNNKYSVVFFGDGAVDEGAFWESVNLACLLKLPVVFVCEDNGLAVHAKQGQRRGYESLFNIIKQFNCVSVASDSQDVAEIKTLTQTAVNSAKQQQKPVFLQFNYYRFLEHVGVNDDHEAPYRDAELKAKAWQQEPVRQQRDKLLALGFNSDDIVKFEQEIKSQVELSIKKASLSPYPERQEDLYTGLYL